MSEEKSVQDQVLEAITEPAVTDPAETVEVVPSPEVKVDEVTPTEIVVETPVEVVDKEKESEINKNLNIALSAEREERKKLQKEIEDQKDLYEKLKNVFSPEEVVVETPPEEKTEEEKFEEWYAQKEASKQEELSTQNLQKKIETEIENLGKEWDGTDGKPKYDDAEVYKWQKENNKVHLMPEEAFFLMKKDDLIDWKSKQNIENSKKGVTGEKPWGSSTEHIPERTTPKNDQEIRNAVLEALSATEL